MDCNRQKRTKVRLRNVSPVHKTVNSLGYSLTPVLESIGGTTQNESLSTKEGKNAYVYSNHSLSTSPSTSTHFSDTETTNKSSLAHSPEYLGSIKTKFKDMGSMHKTANCLGYTLNLLRLGTMDIYCSLSRTHRLLTFALSAFRIPFLEPFPCLYDCPKEALPKTIYDALISPTVLFLHTLTHHSSVPVKAKLAGTGLEEIFLREPQDEANEKVLPRSDQLDRHGIGRNIYNTQTPVRQICNQVGYDFLGHLAYKQ